MARSGQAGSRDQYYSGAGRGNGSRSGGSSRGYGETNRARGAARGGSAQRDGARRGGAYGDDARSRSTHGDGAQNRGEAPQRKSAIREGQGILGWLGTLVRWIVIIILVMVFIKYGKEAYTIGYAVFSEQTVAADGEGVNVTVEITAAMTVDQIGEMLEQNGLLVDGSVFKYQERFSSYHGDIQPGTYNLSTDMTPTEILKAISVTTDEGTAE